MGKKLKYKNVSGSPQALIGIGLVEPGKTVEVEEEIVNQNFELVEEENKSKKDK